MPLVNTLFQFFLECHLSFIKICYAYHNPSLLKQEVRMFFIGKKDLKIKKYFVCNKLNYL